MSSVLSLVLSLLYFYHNPFLVITVIALELFWHWHLL
jgi:hypothetical protein